MNRKQRWTLRMVFAVVLPLVILVSAQAQDSWKTQVLVITGGHGFEQREFFELFEGYEDIEYSQLVHPIANEIYTNGMAMKFDVIALYDLWQPITDVQKEGLIDYLKAGKGLVVLHHAIANYQDWPEFLEIVGGTYILSEEGREIKGKNYKQSTYKHGVDMPIQVVDQIHPITRGIKDYMIHDETYGGMYVKPCVNVLLKSDSPTSSPIVAWAKNYGAGRVAAIQGGHDSLAYKNENYRKLVAQAIRWAAKRPPLEILFNGEDLSGWEAEGEARWSVKDGSLIGEQGPNGEAGDLFTKDVYRNFELTVEYQVKWPANSGIWFRYQNARNAYQADILEWKDPECWSGSLYCCGKMFLTMNEDPKLERKDCWNTFVVRCVDEHIQIFLNGTKVSDTCDRSNGYGKIGVQIHAGDQYKGMAIKIRKAELVPLN